MVIYSSIKYSTSMHKFVLVLSIACLISIVILVHPQLAYAQSSPCTIPFQSLTPPLPDRTTSYTYYPDMRNTTSGQQILSPGLYPNNTNQEPLQHRQHGEYIANNEVTPLNPSGQPDQNGQIGIISIGMSNTNMVFAPFRDRANASPVKNPRVTIINTAINSMVADDWNEPTDFPWTSIDQRLGTLNRNQVQIAWIKITMAGPQNFPDHVSYLHERLVEIVHTAKLLLPNLKIVVLSSRTRSYDINFPNTSQHGLSSEPYAYEDAFAVRDFIGEQIQNPTGRLNLASTPYLTWGPYLWIDGENPRSDGRIWPAQDLIVDCTHPSQSGTQKAAAQLMAFFTTSPLTFPWFLKTNTVIPPLSVSSSITQGVAPVSVQFSATTTSTQVFWSFDDGTTQEGFEVQKTFNLPGIHTVVTTAIDSSGNWNRKETIITIQTNICAFELGDLNCNTKVESIDASRLIYFWGTAQEGADIDHSGTVDGADLKFLLSNYAQLR